jgi:NADPH2:quinone reductase
MLAVQDLSALKPAPGQVLVDVKASALNFPDALMVQGLYQVKPKLPFTPGAEVAGIIAEVGDGVTAWRVGDRVIAFPGQGGFAENCVLAAERLLALPPSMDYASGAALMLTYGTSLHALQDCGQLQAGETLLVLGAAGGVGAAAVQIGKAMGARVIAAASSVEKLELCRHLGADATINYVAEDLRQRTLDLTEGQGVQVVYDPVGGTYTEAALRATGWRGRLLVVGFAAGAIPSIPLNLALLKERALIGVYWGDSVRHDARGHARNMEQLMAWFATGKIRPAVSEQIPLGRAADAMQRLLDRKVLGKIVILPEA